MNLISDPQRNAKRSGDSEPLAGTPPTERSLMNCTACRSTLPDLLLDPASSGLDQTRAHLASCPDCATELRSLQSTFTLLDEWVAPEPSPWFDQRMAARLREAQASQPEGWFERLRSRLLFNTGRQLRPALAGALACALVVSGGAAASLSGVLHHEPAQVSAAVQDLQILDRNDQAFQTMDQLLTDDADGDDGSGAAAAPAS